MDTNKMFPFIAMSLLLLAVEAGALLLARPVQASGMVAFEDPESMANPVIFIIIMLAFTALMLVLIRYDLKKVIAAINRILLLKSDVPIFNDARISGGISKEMVKADIFSSLQIIIFHISQQDQNIPQQPGAKAAGLNSQSRVKPGWHNSLPGWGLFYSPPERQGC